MPVQKYITVQVDQRPKNLQTGYLPSSPAEDCQINIQVANGWAITGYYREHTLQTITLKKSNPPEAI